MKTDALSTYGRVQIPRVSANAGLTVEAKSSLS